MSTAIDEQTAREKAAAGGEVPEMKRYPEYKESGLEWAGEIPCRWQAAQLRRVAHFQSGDSITADRIESEGAFPVYGGNGVRGYTSEYTHDGHFALIGRQGALCGNINHAAGKFWASEHAVVVTPYGRHTTGWLARLLDAMDLRQYSVAAAQPGLAVETIKALRVPVPPPEEQRSIAGYLDRKTAQIDILIQKKQALIDLLREQRTALINRAVTKGLDPDVPMKDSGIEWLGQVPEHWKRSKAKYELESLNHRRVPLSSSVRGQMSDRRFDYYGASGVIDQVEDYLFDEDLILIAEDGANLLSRSSPLAFIARGRYWVNNHAHILKPQAGNIDFFVNLLEAVDYSPFVTGAAQPKLTSEALSNVELPIPPRNEQDLIAAFIGRKTSEVAALIQREQSLIVGLRKLRASLILEVVTGKIDVRDSAAAETPDSGLAA